MKLKDILKFIELEDKRLQERFNYIDKEKMILARTVKVSEEVGELCNEVLTSVKLQRKEKLASHGRKELEGEFADVLLTTLLLARTMEIDIEKSMEEKIEKINERYLKS